MNADKLLGLVDRKMVTDLATEMVNTASPTGEEGEMARLLARMFKEVGLVPQLQNIYDDRYNAIGRLRGSGGGPAILMSGHMDTSVRGDEDYLTGKGPASDGKTNDWLFFSKTDVMSGKLWAGDPNLPNADDGCVVEVPRGTYVVEGIGMDFHGDRVVSRLRVRLESAANPTLGDEAGYRHRLVHDRRVRHYGV